jgi:membrane-associated phospholipid phosphatase
MHSFDDLRSYLAVDWSRPMSVAERLLGGLAGGVLMMAIYSSVAVAMARMGGETRHLPTMVDAAIPFAPVAVLPYAWIFPQALAPMAFVHDRRVFFRSVVAYVSMLLIGIPFWVFWTVTAPRPPLAGDDLFTWGVAMVRWLDPPTNCFPSMHVAEAFLAAFIVRRFDRPIGNALVAAAMLIWWSTIATGQHWFLDGVAGWLTALLVDGIVFRWKPLPAEVWQTEGARSRLAVMALGFLAIVAAAAGVHASGWWPISSMPADW